MPECLLVVFSAHAIVYMATDNLSVEWGVQDHYEIVRKVGRGKYSEVSNNVFDHSELLS